MPTSFQSSDEGFSVRTQFDGVQILSAETQMSLQSKFGSCFAGFGFSFQV
jgi:hypothetical protein